MITGVNSRSPQLRKLPFFIQVIDVTPFDNRFQAQNLALGTSDLASQKKAA